MILFPIILSLLAAFNIHLSNGEVLGGTSFQCIEGNDASNEYCSSYCTTVTSNLVSGKCGKDLNSCICLTADNKSIMVRVVESKEPIPVWKVLPQQSKPPSDFRHKFPEPNEPQQVSPQLLMCDGTTEASKVCNSFCHGVSAQYGICNTSNYQCVCYGVPLAVVQDQPIPAVFNPYQYPPEGHQDQPIPLPEPQHIPTSSTPIPFKNEPLEVPAEEEKPAYQLLKPQIKEPLNLNIFKQGIVENESLTRGQFHDHQQQILQQQQRPSFSFNQHLPQSSFNPNIRQNYQPYYAQQFMFPYQGLPLTFQQHPGQASVPQEGQKEENPSSLDASSHPIPPPFPFPFKTPFYQQAFPIQTHPVINSNGPTVLQPVLPTKASQEKPNEEEDEKEEVRDKRQRRSMRSPNPQTPYCTPMSCAMECDNRGFIGCSSDCRDIGCYCSCLPGMGQNPTLNNIPFQMVDENAEIYDPGVRPPLSPPARPQHIPLSNFMYQR